MSKTTIDAAYADFNVCYNRLRAAGKSARSHNSSDDKDFYSEVIAMMQYESVLAYAEFSRENWGDWCKEDLARRMLVEAFEVKS
jgi:hypothetical protein